MTDEIEGERLDIHVPEGARVLGFIEAHTGNYALLEQPPAISILTT